MKHLKNTFMTLFIIFAYIEYFIIISIHVYNPKGTIIEMVPSIKSAAWDKPLHNEVTFSE